MILSCNLLIFEATLEYLFYDTIILIYSGNESTKAPKKVYLHFRIKEHFNRISF